MLEGPHEQTQDFENTQATKDIANPFAEEEITGNYTKRPLSFEEFKSWRMDEKLKEEIPVWMTFFEKFYAEWHARKEKRINPEEEVWMTKIKENIDFIYEGIIWAINDFNEFNNKFHADKTNKRIASNAEMIPARVLLIKIEPLLYEAYEEARKYVDDDKQLFIRDYRPPMTFEKFCGWEETSVFNEDIKIRTAKHNNFYLRFNMWGHYKDKPEVLKMCTEIPEIYAKLSEAVSGFLLQREIFTASSEQERKLFQLQEPDLEALIAPLQADFYRAYLVARKYIHHDDELFA